MKKEIIQQIVSHLNKKGLSSEDVPLTEDAFVEKLYINSNDRKEFLKALISLFSEDYRSDLQGADILDMELAKKIYELDLVEKEKRFNFVLGKCTKEEQQVVYEKMFKALHFILIAQESSPFKYSSSLLTEHLSKPGIKLSANKLKKLTKKKFNLEQAIQNLEIARNTLEDSSQFMNLQKQFFPQLKTSQQKLEVMQNEESKFLELSSTAESFKLTMEKHVPLPSECRTESLLPAELGTAVGELHSVLQFVAESTKYSSSEDTEVRKKNDLEKIFAQAVEIENNSAISKCFSTGFIGSDEETSAHE